MSENRGVVNILAHLFFDAEGTSVILGGAERYLFELYKIIAEMGYEVRFYQGSKENWTASVGDLKVTGIGGGIDYGVLNRRFHTEVKPSILTIYSPFILGSDAVHENSIGISHGVFWDDPTYSVSQESFLNVRRNVCRALLNCRKIVSVDTNTINWIRTEMSEAREKVVYVPNFVDHSVFSPASRGDLTITILFPRRFCRERGFFLVAEIVPDLVRKYPDIRICFTGSQTNDDPEIPEMISSLSSNHGASVEFNFYLPQDMADAYHSADIVLIPTIAQEGTSLSCLEAMACGKAVIATNVGGLTDLIIDQHNGILINPNKNELKAALDALIGNLSLRNRLAATAFQTSLQFSLDSWRDRWRSVIMGALTSYGNNLHQTEFKSVNTYKIVEEKDALITAMRLRYEGQIAEYQMKLLEKEQEIAEYQMKLLEKEQEIAEYQMKLLEKEQEFDYYREDKEIYIAALRQSEHELSMIKSSLTWQLCDKIFATIRRHEGLERFALSAQNLIFKALIAVKRQVSLQSTEKTRKINTTSTRTIDYDPYESLQLLKPIPVEVVNKDYLAKDIKIPYSLVSPVRNEEKGIVEYLQSIADQELRPNEVIIIDGGSTDGTVKIIREFIEKSPVSMKLISLDTGNISKQRNIAIEAARNDIIVLSDAGCILDRGYCKNLVGPFTMDQELDLVAGIYHALKPSYYTKHFIYRWDSSMLWSEFLPAGKTMAVKKDIAIRCGGFPEFLTYAGEDTLFGIQYRRYSRKWVINKKAFVFWDAPTTKEEAMRKAFLYAKGDGESGIGGFGRYKVLREFQRTGIVSGSSIETNWTQGYLEGRRQRASLEIERRKIVGLALFICDLPLTARGGMHNDAQDALRMIKEGFKVIYVSHLAIDREPRKVFFDIDYSLLDLYHLTEFKVDEFIQWYQNFQDKTIVILRSNQVEMKIIAKIIRDAWPLIKILENTRAPYQ